MEHKTESLEDYLERILMLKKGKQKVRAIDIASSMKFSKASVSIALKKLKANNLVTINEEDGDISLTESGKTLANEIFDRHTLLTNILIDLGVERSLALVDACKIEHDLSFESFQAIKNYYRNIRKK